jgi:hypothetical protein
VLIQVVNTLLLPSRIDFLDLQGEGSFVLQFVLLLLEVLYSFLLFLLSNAVHLAHEQFALLLGSLLELSVFELKLPLA